MSLIPLLCLAPAAGPRAQPEGAETAGVNYRVTFTGEARDALVALMKESSQLIALRAHVPATLGMLRRRADKDMDRFVRVLRSRGHYAGTVRYIVDRSDRPVTVRVTVTPGPVYRIERFAIAYADGAGADLPDSPAGFGVDIGGAARAAKVRDAETLIIQGLTHRGRPFAKVVERQIRVDHESQLMQVRLVVDPGLEARFGPVRVTGLETVERAYLDIFVPWTPGELYDARQIEELRRRLVGAGLFQSVRIRTLRDAVEEARVPIAMEVREGAHRTIGIGPSYSTAEGFGVEGFWEHRNFFNRGERLRISGEVAEIRQELAVDLLKPNFRRLDQSLRLEASLRRQDNDAFRELAVATGARVERPLWPDWRGSLGTSLELTEIEDESGERTFFLVGLPASLRYDSTDNILDPTRGARVALWTTPYVTAINETGFFMMNELRASRYWRITADPRVVLAARSRLGMIAGASRVNVPASKRLYAGGGGSVRGFGYQEAGPLDADGDPLGGRSVVEIGVEVRTQVSESIGVVPFVDAGRVYRNVVPGFDDLFWAAGLGLRYHTTIGPVRVDVAFPLNPRPADKNFQLYISLGQAF